MVFSTPAVQRQTQGLKLHERGLKAKADRRAGSGSVRQFSLGGGQKSTVSETSKQRNDDVIEIERNRAKRKWRLLKKRVCRNALCR